MTESKQKPDVQDTVQKYYGNIAIKFDPNEPKGCCSSSQVSCCGTEEPLKLAIGKQLYEDSQIADLPSEVKNISLGCGDPITLAELTEGQTVLDLGSGGGLDCFLAAGRVGPSGRVIGVDMTSAMIARARENQEKVGAENVEFRLGKIEDLPVPDETVDVILSNCVINLSPDKASVFKEAFRVLKPGGKLAISDIVTDGELPEEIKSDPTAWAACISGAMDYQELAGILQDAGFINIQIRAIDFSGESHDQMRQPDPSFAAAPTKEGILINPDVKLKPAEPHKSVFSAKITAKKPEM